jgi:hypothetical protein
LAELRNQVGFVTHQARVTYAWKARRNVWGSMILGQCQFASALIPETLEGIPS